MHIFLTIVYFIAMFAAIIGIIMLLKRFVFSKVRINKFIPLVLAIVILILQFILKPQNIIINSVSSIVAVSLFAWFWDINQTGNVIIEKEKKIVIKNKPKPNRAKNIKK